MWHKKLSLHIYVHTYLYTMRGCSLTDFFVSSLLKIVVSFVISFMFLSKWSMFWQICFNQQNWLKIRFFFKSKGWSEQVQGLSLLPVSCIAFPLPWLLLTVMPGSSMVCLDKKLEFEAVQLVSFFTSCRPSSGALFRVPPVIDVALTRILLVSVEFFHFHFFDLSREHVIDFSFISDCLG